MKIAHVIATFPPQVGGMGEVAYLEAKGLVNAGHEVTVFTLKYPSVSTPATTSELFKVVRLCSLLKIGDAGLVPNLFFKLRGFDIVHLHYPFYGAAHLVYLAKLLFGQKYIVTYHMDAAPTGAIKRGLQKVYDVIWAKRILTGAEKIVAVDKNHLSGVKFFNKLSSNKVAELYNPVDTNCFKPQTVSLEELGMGELVNKKIILFVGNLLRVKQLDLLFAAAQIIKQSDVVVLVVGSGYDENRYRSLVDYYGLSGRVKFVGACLDRSKLAKYYNVATALAVPSSKESFSLVTAEAMACGRPVIIGSLPGVRERLVDGRDSFLFEPNSAQSLSEKIKLVLQLDKNTLAVVGAAARQKVEDSYSLNKHLTGLMDIYNYVV